MSDKNANNAISHRILHKVHDILNPKQVELCWIPSHTGIIGNEAADQTAESATTRHHEGTTLPYSDWYPSLKEKMFEKWKIV